MGIPTVGRMDSALPVDCVRRLNVLRDLSHPVCQRWTCVAMLALFGTGCSSLPVANEPRDDTTLALDQVPVPKYFELKHALRLTNFIRTDRPDPDRWFPLIDRANALDVLRACPDGVVIPTGEAKNIEFTESGFVIHAFMCSQVDDRQDSALRPVPIDRFARDWLLSPKTYQDYTSVALGPRDLGKTVLAEHSSRMVDPWFHALAVRRCGSIDYSTRDQVWTDRGWIAAQIKCEPPRLASEKDTSDMRPKLRRQPNEVCIRQPGVTCAPVRQ